MEGDSPTVGMVVTELLWWLVCRFATLAQGLGVSCVSSNSNRDNSSSSSNIEQAGQNLIPTAHSAAMSPNVYGRYPYVRP